MQSVSLIFGGIRENLEQMINQVNKVIRQVDIYYSGRFQIFFIIDNVLDLLHKFFNIFELSVD